MKNTALEKGEMSILAEFIKYDANSIVIRTIIKKPTGKISAVSFDSGEALTEKLSRFDNFIHIIDGKAEVIIDGTSTQLETGQAIIIPAHTHNTIKANIRFKMLSTVIKSGYDEVA